VKKWEEKKTHCNIVHVEPRRKKKNDEEIDVQVVTQVGTKIGRDFKKNESLG
jgi:hypothetical protein